MRDSGATRVGGSARDTAVTDDFGLIGTILDRKYRVDRAVAQGGFGVVYAGHHLALDVPVAVKVLKPPVDATPEEWADRFALFIEEGRALARLRHPNIVAILDSGTGHIGGRELPWMVLEWLEGETLEAYFAARRGRGGMTRTECLALLRPVLDAVAAAHEAGFVHRDLKPANVMLVSDPPSARVLDFGIAKMVRAEERELAPSGATATESRAPAFTLACAAPEQLAGNRTGPWTDVFALALLATEALIDGPPVPTRDRAEHYAAVFGDERPTPRAFGIDVGAWEPVLRRALAVRPGERPRDARELLAELDAALEDGSVRRVSAPRDVSMAIPDAVTQPTTQTGRRVPTPVAAALIAATAIGAVGAWLATRARPVATAPATAPRVTYAAITDLPTPPTQSPEAEAEYRRALSSIRAGDLITAYKRLDRALTLDPSLAAAHLRRAIYVVDFAVFGECREHFKAATSLREKLDDRDRALLDALEPAFRTSDPVAGDAEALPRLEALARRHPGDAEIDYLIAQHSPVRAPTLWDPALADDPRFALALVARATFEVEHDDKPAALRTFARCLEVSPDSTACLDGRGGIEMSTGACADAERDVRALLAAAENAGDTTMRAARYWWLADDLLAQGRPIEAAREALAVAAASSTQNPVGFQQAGDALSAAFSGDFVAADEAFAKIEARKGSFATTYTFEPPGVLRVKLALERGRLDVAGQLANGLLKKLGGHADEEDPRPFLYAVAEKAGLRSHRERLAERSAWLAKGERDVATTPWWRWLLWTQGFAEPASSRADAEEALAVRSDYPAYSGYNRLLFHIPELYEGRAKVLAGRDAEAIPLLETSTALCTVLETPLEATQAHLLLAQALEGTGETARACAEYGVVVQRWGHARPRSVSAEAARGRRRGLGCPD